MSGLISRHEIKRWAALKGVRFMEDKAFQNRLGGYKDYIHNVRYGLLPVVW